MTLKKEKPIKKLRKHSKAGPSKKKELLEKDMPEIKELSDQDLDLLEQPLQDENLPPVESPFEAETEEKEV